jgi:hypothetical protein
MFSQLHYEVREMRKGVINSQWIFCSTFFQKVDRKLKHIFCYYFVEIFFNNEAKK